MSYAITAERELSSEELSSYAEKLLGARVLVGAGGANSWGHSVALERPLTSTPDNQITRRPDHLQAREPDDPNSERVVHAQHSFPEKGPLSGPGVAPSLVDPNIAALIEAMRNAPEDDNDSTDRHRPEKRVPVAQQVGVESATVGDFGRNIADLDRAAALGISIKQYRYFVALKGAEAAHVTVQEWLEGGASKGS